MKNVLKRAVSILLVLVLLFSICACGSQTASNEGAGTTAPNGNDAQGTVPADPSAGETAGTEEPSGEAVDLDNGETILTVTRGDVTVTIDKVSGMVTGVASDYDAVTMTGIHVDAGINGSSVFNQIGYKDFHSIATYELPVLYPRMKDMPEYTVDSILLTDEGFEIRWTCGDYGFRYIYTILPDGLAMEAEVTTTLTEDVAVNGVGFVVKGLDGFTLVDTTYEFPGATPAGRRSYKGINRYSCTSSDYSAPAIQFTDGSKTVNVLFVDEVEKWTTGSYYDADNKPCAAFLAAAEGWLNAQRPMTVGTLYIPLRQPEVDPYQAISLFWAELGYAVPADTASTDGLAAVYSAHPYGTMDTGYFNRWTLAEYAEHLDAIAAMGFDAVWLLPVFSHTGSNVYEPIDQGVVDQRYGGIEEAGVFTERAHKLGMSVLFDFVPHGPRPNYSFAREHDNWVAKNMNGENRIEWECVSFDYNITEYYEYSYELAKYYAETIGLDGARIDCSMGGLPNWFSPEGDRASASGLQAGVNVVTALREGFKAGGSEVLLLPENFHPSPAYATVTDVFYDMPLYRAMYDMKWSTHSDAEYAEALTHWLEAEHLTSVAGQLKLRFLGNHDTVSWTFDAARAQKVYGTEKAKALWMAIGWIDGVAFIYQGDEDPATYNLKGENLEAFFTDLISAKRELLPNTLDTRYIYSGNEIFAFYRFREEAGDAKLVLVNLGSKTASFELQPGETVIHAIGGYECRDAAITLEPYTGVILQSDCSLMP